MITVNNKKIFIENKINLRELFKLIEFDPYNELLMKNHFIVLINDEYISEELYDNTIIKENDDVKLIPSIIGG